MTNTQLTAHLQFWAGLQTAFAHTLTAHGLHQQARTAHQRAQQLTTQLQDLVAS